MIQTQTNSRHFLKAVKIAGEGESAERKYELAEYLRKQNITRSEYTKLKEVSECDPIAFPSIDSAFLFLKEDFDECLEIIMSLNRGSRALSARQGQYNMNRQRQIAYFNDQEINQDTIEKIASDILEEPDEDNSRIAERHQVSTTIVLRIRKADHSKLSESTKEKLKDIMFGNSKTNVAAELIGNQTQPKVKVVDPIKEDLEREKTQDMIMRLEGLMRGIDAKIDSNFARMWKEMASFRQSQIAIIESIQKIQTPAPRGRRPSEESAFSEEQIAGAKESVISYVRKIISADLYEAPFKRATLCKRIIKDFPDLAEPLERNGPGTLWDLVRDNLIDEKWLAFEMDHETKTVNKKSLVPGEKFSDK